MPRKQAAQSLEYLQFPIISLMMQFSEAADSACCACLECSWLGKLADVVIRIPHYFFRSLHHCLVFLTLFDVLSCFNREQLFEVALRMLAFSLLLLRYVRLPCI
jgi:hypothetical protein